VQTNGELAKEQRAISAKRLTRSPFTNVVLKFVNPGQALDRHDKWVKMYDEVLVKNVR